MPSLRDRERAFNEGPTLKVPFDVWPGDKDYFPPFPFPFLAGDTTNVKGWKLVKAYSIDKGPSSNTHNMTEMEFLANIRTGKGYAYLEKGPLKTVIGEYIHVDSTS